MTRARGQGRWLRFLISGGIGFALYYGFALLLTWMTPWADGSCAFVGTLLAIPPTFLLQRSFTFRSDGGPGGQAAGYLLLQLASSAIIGSSAYFAARLGIPTFLGFFLAGIAGVLFSYVIQASLIFKR